ncbi:malto-oligosyltrehalose trehalohydrolase (plasmid) [Rhizobium sp. T1470]|uniref:malto-oligosyltrehalose trehalohydrolase n=1 Tax=unclassified Rhizobium TaxID=2613769 RepID=UPI001AAFEEEA|nr:malto-oligosyltrehalose trehalohydrolase [Rhizobium sp. T1473]MCA0805748.1 malto-oligosyltrehalose trehalohydrolase [Rhizobium sp. T1473]
MFSFGPQIMDEGVRFRLWAPLQPAVGIIICDRPPCEMLAEPGGWFTFLSGDARHGSLYRFVLADGQEIPDPASRYQPDDVHGPSEVVDGSRYSWVDGAWRGRPWSETILYEMHIGTFTQAGTLAAATQRLDHLERLGVTAIQLMPVNDFPGRRGWGYDGVLPYALDSSYGRPEDLKAFIDAAHQRRISVFLDVVYNHFGPEGNYLPSYVPLSNRHHKTPWGPAINYDGEHSDLVRKFVVENALYWLEEFRADGLRFDAVHAIKDESGEHLLAHMARTIRRATRGRHCHLIVENEDNAASLLERDEDGKPLLYTAQWNDDIHHALHRAASGEAFGYYADYSTSPSVVARAIAEGFIYQGETMPYKGAARGQPSDHLPPTAFVAFIQNHDQVGNRAHGDRLHKITPQPALEAIASVYLLCPQVPMIFMGEEWKSEADFPYFCDFNDELNATVRKGRREELHRLPGFDEEGADTLPDPTDETTFLSAKLDWNRREQLGHREFLELYRHLITVRRVHIVPLLDTMRSGGHIGPSRQLIDVHWDLREGRKLHLIANLSHAPVATDLPQSGSLIWRTQQAGDLLPPWYVCWTLEDEPLAPERQVAQ